MNKSVETYHTGYPGSGFYFHFERCVGRKVYQDAVREVYPNVVTKKLLDSDGFTICERDEVLRGILPQSAPVSDNSSTHFIVDVHIIVPATADGTDERRRWYHEIGHAVDFCAQHMAIVRRDHCIKAEGQCSDEETRALLTEFLMGSLNSFLNGGEVQASSGLLDAMPWAAKSEVKRG